MTDSARQYAYLKAMGIDAWVTRNPQISSDLSIQSQFDESSHQPAESKLADESIQTLQETPGDNLTVTREDTGELAQLDNLSFKQLEEFSKTCTACELCHQSRAGVFAAGNQQAQVMLITDAPLQAAATDFFAEKSNELLNAMLSTIGMQRKEIYITSLVKCCSSEKQEPSLAETNACQPILKRQVELVKPGLIIALGALAGQRLLNISSNLKRLRGQINYSEALEVPVVVTYHPEYLLRSQNDKRKAWEDLQLVMQHVEKD